MLLWKRALYYYYYPYYYYMTWHPAFNLWFCISCFCSCWHWTCLRISWAYIRARWRQSAIRYSTIDIANAEIKVSSADNPELPRRNTSFKRGINENIVAHAQPAAGNSALPLHSTSFSPNPLQTYQTFCVIWHTLFCRGMTLWLTWP